MDSIIDRKYNNYSIWVGGALVAAIDLLSLRSFPGMKTICSCEISLTERVKNNNASISGAVFVI